MAGRRNFWRALASYNSKLRVHSEALLRVLRTVCASAVVMLNDFFSFLSISCDLVFSRST